MAETIGVNLVGSAGGFVSAIDSATSSLDRLDKKVGSMGGIGTFLKNTILPAAASIGAAFGAHKSLSVFAESDLPGAKKYVEALEASKSAVTKLGAAVGEYLAPGAIRVARLVELIATKLEPMVRKFTAFSVSAGEFLFKLGQNALQAFRDLIPVLDTAATFIEKLFTGPARDWTEDIERFRQWWNSTWDSILRTTAPIIVAASDMISQAFTTIGEVASVAWESVNALMQGIGGAGGDIAAFGGAVQSGFVKAIAAAEFALKNWRLTADIVWTAIKFGFQTTIDFFGVGWRNAVTGLKYFADEAKTLFGMIFGPGGYVVSLMKEVFLNFLPQLVANSAAAAANNFIAITTAGKLAKWKNPAVPDFQAPLFDFKPRAFPAMEGIAQGDKAAGLSATLKALTSSFGDGVAKLLGDKLPGLGQRAQDFVDAIKAGLPGVNANVPVAAGPGAAPWAAPDNRNAGLFIQGSQDAYREIMRLRNDPNGTEKSTKKIAEDHLAVAKDTRKLLQDNLAKPARGALRAGGLP